MKVICVDEEKDTLFKTMTLLKGIPEISAVVGFFSGKAALQYLKNGEKADITLVDTDISAAGGLDLVKTLRTKYPDISIIITSENNDYAVEAFSMHVSGYILKPLNKRVLSKEIAFCVTQRDERIDNRRGGINVRTFGNFDISVDGVTVSFTRSKAKELLVATSLRSSEISTEVGYSDRHYFSYLFKKNTGMTPSEYRKQFIKEEEKEQ